MPPRLLEEFHDRSKPIQKLSEILELSERFGVSPGVVLQRVTQSIDLLDPYYAVLLLRGSQNGECIEASAHTNWLVPAPTIGQVYSEWARSFQTASQIGPDQWERSLTSGDSIVLTNATRGEFGRFVEPHYRSQ